MSTDNDNPFHGRRGIALVVQENPECVDVETPPWFVSSVLMDQTDPNRCLFRTNGMYTPPGFGTHEAAVDWCVRNELEYESRPWK